MGLAAGQARLLTITARKSDCEYQSMKLSHQKIALSRQLSDLSNEYQNSLDQTKLIYDYYGTGDESTALSYGLLMTPSALNDYKPITITDSLGRVTLNSKYAAAARAAGIPQEGLGTLPSEKMRNSFIQGLAGSGLITDQVAATIQGIPYNQQAGFGGDVTAMPVTFTGNIDTLKDYIYQNCTGTFSPQSIPAVKSGDTNGTRFSINGGGEDRSYNTAFTLSDLLSDEVDITVLLDGNDGETYCQSACQVFEKPETWESFITFLETEFSSVLVYDDATQAAMDYAVEETKKLITSSSTSSDQRDQWAANLGGNKKTDKNKNNVINNDQNYIGTVVAPLGNGAGHKNNNGYIALNLNNIVDAFLTYFVDKMNGLNATGVDGNDRFHVEAGSLDKNNLVTNDKEYEFTIYTGESEIVGDDLKLATYYDILFNQICANGWTENNNIEDNDYLQNMLQSGMLYISKIKDDGYYYQGNYATDTYIKEISDETAIAQAEAKYNTEKAKLNSKEETLDLKMKNLDTEISSLTTEYDTVKNTISKNIEKSFKRYNA